MDMGSVLALGEHSGCQFETVDVGQPLHEAPKSPHVDISHIAPHSSREESDSTVKCGPQDKILLLFWDDIDV